MHRLRVEEDGKTWLMKGNIVRAIHTSRKLSKRIKFIGSISIGGINLKKMLSKSE